MLTILYSIDTQGVHFLKYLSVYILSTFHFFTALTTGLASDLSLIEIIIPGILGVMTTLSAFLFGGPPFVVWLQRHLPARLKRKQSSEKNRKKMERYSKYGTWGVALLIPIVINPIMGGILHTSLKSPAWATWWISLVASAFWIVITSLATAYSVDLLL